MRVLHVGKSPGNAYLNAKFLRSIGIECHVLSYDYYHPIGTPEWEDGVEPPAWYARGPFPQCAAYLNALLDDARPPAPVARKADAILVGKGRTRSRATHASGARRCARRARSATGLHTSGRMPGTGSCASSRSECARCIAACVEPGAPSAGRPSDAERRLAERLAILGEFERAFPERADRLAPDEVENWQFNVERWKKLLARYDVVQGYGTDVIRPYVARTRPYVGYEHGTLRDFTLGDDPTHRMTALAYRSADHVFITNGDCLEFAKRIGVERLTPMIHPVDVDRHRRPIGRRRDEIRANVGADVMLLCPLRHDWAIKGTDIHLRALPLIRAALDGRSVSLVTFEWGLEIDESKALLEELRLRRRRPLAPTAGTR